MRTKTSVWWPEIASQVSEMIKRCPECSREADAQKEPLIASPLPDYPWQMIGSDLFELSRVTYLNLLLMDYFSRYPEVVKLTSTTSVAVITTMKSIFSRHGILEVVLSDNGPQYLFHEFEQFTKVYNFQHLTSSPQFP